MPPIPPECASGNVTRKRWATHVFANPGLQQSDVDIASQGMHGAPAEDMASNAGSGKSSTGGRTHDTTLEAVRALLDLTDWEEVKTHLEETGFLPGRISQVKKRMREEGRLNDPPGVASSSGHVQDAEPAAGPEPMVAHAAIAVDNAMFAEPAGPDMLARTQPVLGESFLIVKPEWQELIYCGSKTIEVRHRKLKPGRWFMGHKTEINGFVVVGEAFIIRDDAHWKELAHAHCVHTEERLYSKANVSCWANPLSQATRVQSVRYLHPRGAIGIVKFQPPPSASPESLEWQDVLRLECEPIGAAGNDTDSDMDGDAEVEKPDAQLPTVLRKGNVSL